MLPVPLNSWKISSSIREPVSISAVATIVREPASSVLRAEAKILRGISSARASTPPVIVRPEPPCTELKARATRVIESSNTKTSLPDSTRRRQRSTTSRERRTCVSRSWSLDEAITSASTERVKSVTSSGRSSISNTITCTSLWLVVTALAICLRMVVLPVRGGATMSPRVPLPIGVTKSMIRVSTMSGVVSRLNFSMGLMVVRFSNRTMSPYSSNDVPLTLSTSLSCGLVPR